MAGNVDPPNHLSAPDFGGNEKLGAAAEPVEICGLVTRIGDTVIHQDVALTIRRSEILGLVGASGSGKSLLLQSLIGLRKPTAGSVKLFGADIYSLDEISRRTLGGRMGVVFQANALFSTLTVLENVSLVLREHTALPEDLIGELASVKVFLAGLPRDAAPKFPSDLSGGMAKRAAVARAIALDPELLLLDEPTTGLDPVVANQIDELILQLRDTLGMTVLVITHDLDTLFTICDRVAVLAERHIIAIGKPTEVAQQSHPWIQQYFQGERGAAVAKSRAANSTLRPSHREERHDQHDTASL